MPATDPYRFAARFDALLHRIYDAALAPDQWPAVLVDIAQATQASHALLYTPVHTPAQGGFLFPHNIPQASLELWAARSIHEDPFVQQANARGILQYGEGIAIDGFDLVPEPELLRTTFYRDLWAPIGIGRVCSGIVFDGTDAHKLPTALAVYRRPTDPPFDQGQVDLIRRLVAHVSRALGVMFHLRDSGLQVASSLAALNRLAASVVLLAPDRTVQFANPAAKRMLERVEPLRLRSDGRHAGTLSLAARMSGQECAFQRCVDDALCSLSIQHEAAHFSQAMVLADPAGRPTCVLHVAPLGDAATFQSGVQTPRAIVLAYDLAAAHAVQPEALCRLFGMTPAEARAALEILQGGSAAEMAKRLGLSVNTLKTQLQAAYLKTSTNRQVDLLKLLMALAATD